MTGELIFLTLFAVAVAPLVFVGAILISAWLMGRL